MQYQPNAFINNAWQISIKISQSEVQVPLSGWNPFIYSTYYLVSIYYEPGTVLVAKTMSGTNTRGL